MVHILWILTNLYLSIAIVRNMLVTCDICTRSYNCIKTLRGHKSAKHSKTSNIEAVCKFCSKIYPNKFSLQRHVRYLHEDNFNFFKCNFCDYKARDKQNLGRHIKRIHTEDGDKSKCKFCEKEVSRMRQHINAVHLKKKIECATCQKQFTRASHLKTHIDSIHN